MSSSSEGDILLIVSEKESSEFLSALLMGEGYNVKVANNQEEGFLMLGQEPFHLVIADFASEKVNGMDICKSIRSSFDLKHSNVILLMETKDSMAKIKGIYAGADDYVEKPFEPAELLARVKASFVRMTRDLDANPLTKLPGNISVMKEMEARLKSKELFAVGYVDLNKFKEFNDGYGFEMGDKIIYYTAQIIIKALKSQGSAADFLGHIGGDDFIFITTTEKWEDVAKEVVGQFEAGKGQFYNEEDKKRGYVVAKNRMGDLCQIPLVGIAVAVITNECRTFTHVAHISQVAAELKHYAKSLGGSVYVKDKRKN